METARFSQTHIAGFLRSARSEGWITDQAELDFLLSRYPQGCQVCLAEGNPVAFITSLRYARSAWIGNLLVVPERRQQGIGRRLMQAVLDDLDRSGCETVWLTASADGAHLYRTLGFAEVDRVQRWRGSGSRAIRGGKPGCSDRTVQLDSLGWGDSRQLLFDSVSGPSACFQDDTGFLVYSPLADGMHIGPWGALSAKGAAMLLDSAANSVGERSAVFLDVPEKNSRAGELLSSCGYSVSGSTLLMYRGTRPDYRPEHIYALASMGSYG